MWQEFFIAVALLLVLEGAFPFLFPSAHRKAMQAMAQQNERALRLGGLASMVIGVLLLYLIR